MYTVFIDGSQGTTGLRIVQRLSQRKDIELLRLPEEKRKDSAARREMLNSCDVALLCLPDAAAMESADMVDNPHVRILDTSTAHRTAPGWAYGFPELSEERRAQILKSRRIAVPGCHASGFIALVHPLVAAGILPRDALLSCHSITGYSGGGKKMIAEYEADGRDVQLDAPRQYGLTQQHKHLREMQKITGIDYAPIFSPIVSDFYSGCSASSSRAARASMRFGPSMKRPTPAPWWSAVTDPRAVSWRATPRRAPTVCTSVCRAIRSAYCSPPAMTISARAPRARPYN